MLGICQGALNKTIPYTKERQQFGQRIYDFQVFDEIENFLIVVLVDF